MGLKRERVTKENIRKIREAASEGKLVLFIGAGVSANSGYKDWNHLIQRFAEEMGYPGPAPGRFYDTEQLLRIPQIFYDQMEHTDYERIITEEFGDRETMQNPILDELLKLHPQHIITTNFDHLIEYALERNHIYGQEQSGHLTKYAVIAEDSDLIELRKSSVLLKMHGDVSRPDSIVLKEDDYLQYSHTHVLIETFIRSLLINHTFLFAGYGLNDNNLKLTMSWVDEIIKKYEGKVSRKEYFFLYSNVRAIPEFDRIYYEKKNIRTMEIEDFPEEYREQPLTSLGIKDEKLPNPLGRKLYRMAREIVEKDYMSWKLEDVYEGLLCFRCMEVITYYDIAKRLRLTSDVSVQIDESLYIRTAALEGMCRILTDVYEGEEEEMQLFIRQTFGKAGIHHVMLMDGNVREISRPARMENKDVGSMTEYLLEFDFQTLQDRMKKTEKKSAADYLRLSNLAYILSDYQETERNLQRAEKVAKEENDVIRDVIAGMDRYQWEQSGERDEFVQILDVLSEKTRAAIPTLLEYGNWLGGFHSKVDKYLLKTMRRFNPYSDGYSTVVLAVANFEVRRLRTELYGIYRYLMENGVFLYSYGTQPPPVCDWQGIVDSYVELLFHDKGRIQYTRFDYFIILQFMDTGALRLLQKRYGPEGLAAGREALDYRKQVLENLEKSSLRETEMGKRVRENIKVLYRE